MIDLRVIMKQVFSSLITIATGLYLIKVSFGIISRANHKRRLLSRTLYIAIISFVVTIVLYQIKTVSVINNVASGQTQLATSRSYQNISLGRANVAMGGGGYVTGIYLHPLQQDLVYIKTDVGGFYRWNPVARSWVPLTDHFPLPQSHYYYGEALALDPKNPNIIYIAAGAYLWDKPGTIFKSTDQGATWTKLNLDLKMGGNEHLRWVGERLAVNPFNSNDIFFGSRRDGLWKSSDAGVTWTKDTSFPGKPTTDIGITAIALDKQKPGVVYANAYGDGIYNSKDMGVTWSKVAGSPSQTNRIAIASNGVLYVTHTSGVSKYINGAWKKITPGWFSANFNGLSVNLANSNDLLVSLDQTRSTKIYRSLDGGATWKEKKASLNNTVAWWDMPSMFASHISALEFDPKVAGRVWFTDWYGIWQSKDINASPVVWTNHEKGHEELVIFALASPPSGPLLLSGVADVDGFYHNNGLDTYPSKTFSDNGKNGPRFQDTYGLAYSESNPSRMVRVGGHRWNNTYTGATSTNGGLTWKQFASWPSPNIMPLRVAMSATNPNLFIVTVSGGQPLRTADNGASWQSVSGLPNGDQGPWNFSQPLVADKVNGNTFYYYGSGKVYRSTDGGKAFEVVSSLPSEHWHSLKTIPGVEGEVWVSLDWNGLYRSTDGGKTFSRLDGVERAYLFAFGKSQPGSTIPTLYLYGITGKGAGIFRSLDRGKTWASIGDPQKPIGNNPKVMEASMQKFGLIFIGTNGRGIYYGDS